MIQLRFARSFLPTAILIGSVFPRLAPACEINAVQQSWILPNVVDVFEDQSKKVAGVVACGATSDNSGLVRFDMNLIDADLSVGETAGQDDDVLSRHAISAMAAGPQKFTGVIAGHVYSIGCTDKDIFGSMGEGGEGSPADLALQIVTEGQVPFAALPKGGAAPAVCRRSVSKIALALASVPGEIPFPDLPPVTDLPFGVRLTVKSGEAHFEFITGAAGPFPDTLTIDVAADLNSPQFAKGVKTQDAPLILSVSGDGAFVDVAGTVTQEGVIDASARGTVAGFPNTLVTLTGTLRGGTLDAEYTMGADGSLPGGFPIVFALTGESQEIADFWSGAGDSIVMLADALAQFHAVPLGGVDIEDATLRLAANLTVAQAGLRYYPQNGFAQTAFAGIAMQLGGLADEVAS
ncbi:MAG: hypothetical protein R2748_19105, partial [Bryobacterales bacterium]